MKIRGYRKPRRVGDNLRTIDMGTDEKNNDCGSVREAVAERNAIFAAAMARKDAAGVAECYTEDGEFMAGGSPSFEGRAAIQKAIAGFIGQGFTKYEVLSTTIYGDEGI